LNAKGPQPAKWTEALRRSALEDMLVETARSDVLSLALGLPSPELFPTGELARAAAELLAGDARALQYAPPLAELRERVARLMRRRGVTCAPEQVFLTAGAQQAMSLVTRVLLEPGAPVLVERCCYTGFQQVLAPYAPRILTVPTLLDSGMDVGAVERLLRSGERPALLYAMSDGHNPTGVSMSMETRCRLVDLARRWEVPVLEDDAYGMLTYDDEELPALRSLDQDWVIYLGSFSKTVAPALRAGWAIVPERLVGPLSSLKESSDINTATLGHRLVARFLASGRFEEHVETAREEYARRRDALLAALAGALPENARWSVPRAGFFTWVELPGGPDTVRLLEVALETERVAFVPGAAFAAGDTEPLRSALRLNFSHHAPERLVEGVARLSRALGTLEAAMPERANHG
jgi:2-aminoadipate transaminase